jgi:hypothetical protein
MLAFGAARASKLFALLHQNRGGMELGSIVSLFVFLVVLIFAVRRRHVSAWRSTVHVMGSLVVGNGLAIVMIWPFVPQSYDVSLTPLLRETVAAGAFMAILTLPLTIAMLWLSRRFGSHSQVTERRMRVIQDILSRRARRDQGTPEP